jgi:hypothetical protein
VGSIAEHRFYHRKASSRRRSPGKENPLVECACGCGSTMKKFDRSGRPRQYKPGGHWRRGKGKLQLRPNPEVLCSCGCGLQFKKFDSEGRERQFVSGHNARGRRQ